MKKDKEKELFTLGKLLSGRKNTDMKDFYQEVKKQIRLCQKSQKK